MKTEDLLELEKIKNDNTLFKNYQIILAQKKMYHCASDEVYQSIFDIFNWCFYMKNNFFIENFNSKTLRAIRIIYNRLKNNLFNNATEDIFYGLTEKQIKLVKYILIQYLINYKYMTDDVNSILAERLPLNNAKMAIAALTDYINQTFDENKAPY